MEISGIFRTTNNRSFEAPHHILFVSLTCSGEINSFLIRLKECGSAPGIGYTVDAPLSYDPTTTPSLSLRTPSLPFVLLP